MLEKIWLFIKENVTVIITVLTAIFAFVYAVLRLCVFVYWKGYFTCLHIDENAMNLNFDKSIFSVIFVSIILLIIVLFMSWTYDIINDIIREEVEKEVKGIKKISKLAKHLPQIIFLSFVVLAVINVPLVVLLFSITRIKCSIYSVFLYVIVIYTMEVLLLISQKIIEKKQDKKNKNKTKDDIIIKVFQIFAVIFIILVMLFNQGSNVIEERTQFQLVKNEEYVITYCDGEHYVLHKAEYENETITIYTNKQIIVSVEDCELTVVEVDDVIIEN